MNRVPTKLEVPGQYDESGQNVDSIWKFDDTKNREGMILKVAVPYGELKEIEMRTERRQDARFPMRSTIRVQKCDGGSTNWMSVKGLNLSENGVAFLSSQPIAVGSLLQVELPKSRSTAIGPVRNCQQRGSKWRIGVQLAKPFLGLS